MEITIGIIAGVLGASAFYGVVIMTEVDAIRDSLWLIRQEVKESSANVERLMDALGVKDYEQD